MELNLSISAAFLAMNADQIIANNFVNGYVFG